MINLAEKQRIIIEAVLKGKTQRRIAKDMKISRTTVARYLGEYEKAKSKLMEGGDPKLKEEIIYPPKYDSSKRIKVKLTGKIIEKIKFYLAENEEKRATGRSKQQKKKIDILEALIDEGFDIGYTTVCNAVREIERKKKEAFIKQHYNWGDSAEFDWGEVKLVISGKLKIVQMGAFTPAKSNYRYADLYYTKKMENFLHLHGGFFSHVKGVYREIVYDNLRTAVAKFVGRSHKKATDDLLKISAYYNFSFRFCNCGKGNEKGHVEKSIEYIRRRVFSKRDVFSSLEEAREYLRQELVKLNQKPQVLVNGETAENMLKVERGYLLPLPPKYDSARTFERRVNKYSCFEVDCSFYSVPDCYVGEFVFVKVYPDRIIAYYKEEEIAAHSRRYGNFKWAIDIDHYRQTFLKKPGALANSLALLQAAPELKKIYTGYYIGSEKEFIELLEVIGAKGLDVVKNAIAKLEAISPRGIGTDSIKMIVQRNYDKNPKISKEDSQIEAYSKEILKSYSSLLVSSGKGASLT
ncbi:IS21 family transposase [Actinomycetota bacterium]